MATSRDDFGIAIRSALLQRGARQKFSLFALIITSIIIFTLDNLKLKPVEFLRSIINDGVYRISAVSSSPIRFSSATKDFFIKHVGVYKENEKLKTKIAELEKNQLNTLYLETENQQLQKVIEIDKSTAFTTVGAKVMMDKNSPYLNSAIINKGRNSGLKLGMPVLSKGHLVGRIVEVNFLSSRFLLLNDLYSRIPAVITFWRSSNFIWNWRKKTYIRISSDGFIASEDQTVYTSGKDGVLFSNFYWKVLNEDGRIKVKLFSDPTQTFFINVVIDKASDVEAM